MADQSQYTRIYDVKAQGIDVVLNDLNKIIAKFDQLAKVKATINQGGLIDPDIMKQTNAQLEAFAANIEKIGEIQKGVSADVQQGAQAMTANLTASSMAVHKVGAALEQARTESISYASDSATLGERLAALKEQATTLTANLKLLGEQYRENAISDAEYNTELEVMTTQLQQVKTQIGEVVGAMTAMNKVYNPALTEEENAALAENRVLLQQRTQLLKLQAVAEQAAEGSISEARAQVALYRKELNDLNLTTEEGIKRQQELITVIAELDAFIKNNADLYTRQKINIGNYPNPSAELSAIRAELQRLTLAGEQTGAEFAALQARAQQLAGAMQEVKAATTETAGVTDRFNSIVQRMGLRLIANLLIFQAAIELIGTIKDRLQQSAEQSNYTETAMSEMAKNSANNFSQEAAAVEALRNRFNDLSSTENDKMEVVDELNEKFGNQIDKINDVNDAEKFFVDKSDAFIRALNLRAQATAALNVITEQYQKQLQLLADPKSVGLDWMDKTMAFFRSVRNRPKDKDEAFQDFDFEELAQAAGKANKEIEATNNQIDFLLKEYTRLQNEAQKIDTENGFDTRNKAGKNKKDRSTIKEEYQAERDLAAAFAELQKEKILRDQQGDKEIMDNTANSYNERLQAASHYYYTIEALAQTEADKELGILDAKKDEYAKKLKDGKITQADYDKEIEALRLQNDALNLKTTNAIAANRINQEKTVTQFVKDEYDKQNRNLDNFFTAQITSIEEQATKRREADYKAGRTTDKSDYRETLEKDRAQVQQDEKIAGLKSEQLSELQLRQNQDAETVALEKKLYDDLLKLRKKYVEDKDKLQKDEHAHDIDQQKLTQMALNGAIDIAQTFANEYVNLLQKEDAAREKMMQRNMEWNMKLWTATAQSKQDLLKAEKAQYIEQQQLDHQKALDDKKRAETKEAIDFGTAASQLAVNVLRAAAADDSPDGGLTELAIGEGILAAKFAVIESMIASAPAYAGGTGFHPGGLAWVGDGGEREFLKIGGNMFASPSVPTLVNMSAGAQVMPFSQLGANLRAPSFGSSSATAMPDFSQLHQSVSMLHGAVSQIAAGMANMKVTLDTQKAGRAIDNSYYKNVRF